MHNVKISKAVTIQIEVGNKPLTIREQMKIIENVKKQHFQDANKWTLTKSQSNGYVTTAFFVNHEKTVSYGHQEIPTN